MHLARVLLWASAFMVLPLAEGTDGVFAGRPLIKAVLAAAADFFRAVGQALRRLHKLPAGHPVVPLQAVLHADLLAEIAADAELRAKQQLLLLFCFGQF